MYSVQIIPKKGTNILLPVEKKNKKNLFQNGNISY